MPKYPTKEQILNYKETPNKFLVIALTKWKTKYWSKVKNKDINLKREELCKILNILAILHNSEINSLNFATTTAKTCMYDPRTKTIFLDNSGSIISALHELGHHFYGRSELKACAFSINLFKESFPQAYAKLKWEGHMLKKV